MKKIIGIILLVLGAIALLGGIANGSLFSVNGGGAYAAGQIVGKIIGYAIFIGGGIALIVTDKK